MRYDQNASSVGIAKPVDRMGGARMRTDRNGHGYTHIHTRARAWSGIELHTQESPLSKGRTIRFINEEIELAAVLLQHF